VSEEPTLYEAMYIIDAGLEDEQVEAVVAQVNKVVENAGGEVVANEDFGRRRLAYQIKQHTEGLYKLLYFRGGGPVVDELKHEFQLNEAIIRGLVVIANPQAIYRTAQAAIGSQAAEEEQEAAGEPQEAAEEPLSAEEEIQLATETVAEQQGAAQQPEA